MSHFQFSFQSLSSRELTIRTDLVLNLPALMHDIWILEGVLDVYWSVLICPYIDDNIDVTFSQDTATVTFSECPGDCYCDFRFRQFWEFSVNKCQAEFKRTYNHIVDQAGKEVLDSFLVFPNPVSGKLYFSDCIAYKKLIQIYNLHGELITQIETAGNEIDFTEFSKGVYILRVSNKHKIAVIKVIKQ